MGLRQADLLVRQDLDGRPPKQSSIHKRGEHYEKKTGVMKAPPAGLETSCS